MCVPDLSPRRSSSLHLSSMAMAMAILPPPNRPSFFHNSLFRLPPFTSHRIVCSASAGALSGSPDWNIPISKDSSDTDKLIGEKPRKKRSTIAGVEIDELVDPWLLAEPDSRFAEFYGVQIHYKIAHSIDDDRATPGVSGNKAQEGASSSEASNSFALPAILLHGFGASLFSWERVLRPLARVLGAKVVAFDRPAFGLTSRISVPENRGDGISVNSNPYTIGFSSAATLAFIDFLQSEKGILIGHSAGCLVAADAYLKAPECVAAIIMVAPALVAPLLVLGKTQTSKDRKIEGEIKDKQASVQTLLTIWNKILWAVTKIMELVQRICAFIRRSWYRMLAAVLRSSIARFLLRFIMDKLSLQAVRYAWYDKEKVDDYVISGYTKPLRCRDWEYALLEYVVAMVGDPVTKSERSLGERLGEILCPVLVVTGDSDGIVPAWNAERLSKILPKAHYHVIKDCGHLPHEEKPEEFLTIVGDFIQWVQQGAKIETKLDETVVFMPA